MDGQPDGITFIIRAKRIKPLTIKLTGVVIQVLLNIKNVIAKSGQFSGGKHIMISFMSQPLCNALLSLKIYLLLIVLYPR